MFNFGLFSVLFPHSPACLYGRLQALFTSFQYSVLLHNISDLHHVVVFLSLSCSHPAPSGKLSAADQSSCSLFILPWAFVILLLCSFISHIWVTSFCVYPSPSDYLHSKWCFLGPIHIVANCMVSSLIMINCVYVPWFKKSSPLVLGTCVISRFWLLWIVLQWTEESRCPVYKFYIWQSLSFIFFFNVSRFQEKILHLFLLSFPSLDVFLSHNQWI